MASTDVLIVGAGPTGLVLALWLTLQGIGVRIIDKTAGPGTTSRALAVQARTLELYRLIGLADAVIAAGHKNPGINIWVKGHKKARLDFGDAGADLTPYPFLLIYPQDEHEALLVARLAELGVTVERQTEFVDFADKGGHITARLRNPDGEDRMCEALYIAGCDGARSPVRHQIGAEFAGGTYSKTFYVADVQVSGAQADGDIHIALETADFLALMAYDDQGGSRLIGTVEDPSGTLADTLTFADIGHAAIGSLGLTIRNVKWFSTYRIHHRVADHYRHGRAFLVGDAAHVHSPAGGQGMNTGIGDAINLAWKLAAVIRGRAPDALLDSYQSERAAFARKLVDTTDRVFTFVTADGIFADFVRTRIAPIFAPIAASFGPVREYMFRILSQTMINYRECPLNEGEAGKVAGGDRLPWLRFGDSHNYDSLSAIGWQVHVYGEATDDLVAWCAAQDVALHRFPWSSDCEKAGLQRSAVYLLRPDSYVGLADRSGEVAAITDYLLRHGLKIAAGFGTPD